MQGSGGGGGASSTAVSGSGPINFGGDGIPAWLIGVGIGAGVLIVGLLAWAFTRK